ncbi:MAG: hypothetical protein ABII74_07055 [Elusimicrobiota bacterium]
MELESRYLKNMKMEAGKNNLYGGLAFLIHPAKIFMDQISSLLSSADFKLRGLTKFTFYINRQTNRTKIALRSL